MNTFARSGAAIVALVALLTASLADGYAQGEVVREAAVLQRLLQVPATWPAAEAVGLGDLHVVVPAEDGRAAHHTVQSCGDWFRVRCAHPNARPNGLGIESDWMLMPCDVVAAVHGVVDFEPDLPSPGDFAAFAVHVPAWSWFELAQTPYTLYSGPEHEVWATHTPLGTIARAGADHALLVWSYSDTFAIGGHMRTMDLAVWTTDQSPQVLPPDDIYDRFCALLAADSDGGDLEAEEPRIDASAWSFGPPRSMFAVEPRDFDHREDAVCVARAYLAHVDRYGVAPADPELMVPDFLDELPAISSGEPPWLWGPRGLLYLPRYGRRCLVSSVDLEVTCRWM